MFLSGIHTLGVQESWTVTGYWLQFIISLSSVNRPPMLHRLRSFFISYDHYWEQDQSWPSRIYWAALSGPVSVLGIHWNEDGEVDRHQEDCISSRSQVQE